MADTDQIFLFPEEPSPTEKDSSTTESTKQATQKTKSNKNKNKNKTTTTPAKPTPPVEVLPVDKDRIVYYAGHRIAIPDRTLSLEAIRQQLELEYPELSASRTLMQYDDTTGMVVPIVTAAKKGRIYQELCH